ncbi:MAG: hypothetical protein ABJB12_02795 [Pseudomonadota bacterium]
MSGEISSEAKRIRRSPPWPWPLVMRLMPASWLERADGPLGYVLLERGAVT